MRTASRSRGRVTMICSPTKSATPRKLGYAQKRIDALLRMLPELREAGTIHIDAFKSIQGVRPSDPISSPLLGYTIEDELAAQRKILRYWRMKGVDVSTEYAANTIDPDPFVGLQVGPNCLDIDKLLDIDWYHKPAKFLGFPPDLMAAAPCAQDGRRGDWHVLDYHQLLSRFCMQVVPWCYRNNPMPKEERFNFSPDYFSDVFILALWRPWTLLAYSTNGNYDFSKLPKTLVLSYKRPEGGPISRLLLARCGRRGRSSLAF